MDAWNRWTDLRRRGCGDWKRVAEDHECRYAQPMDRDNDVVKAGGTGSGAGQSRAKGGEIGDICNSINNKCTTKIVERGSYREMGELLRVNRRR